MTDFRAKIRNNTAKIVVAAATVLPGSGYAQKEMPPLPEGLAGQMLVTETCLAPKAKSDELICDSDHVALYLLVKRMEDVKKRKGGKLPETITLTLPISEDMLEEKKLSTAKLQSFSDALDTAKVDKYYPVALSTRDSGGAEAIGTRGASSGLILLDMEAFEKTSVPQLVKMVQSAIDKLKQKQQELAPGQLRA